MNNKEFIEKIKYHNIQENTFVLVGMVTQYCLDNDITVDTYDWDWLIIELWEEFETALIKDFDDKDTFDYWVSQYLC